MAAGSSPQPESPELEATLLGASWCRRSLPALLLLRWALRSRKQQQLQGRVAAAPWQLRWFSCTHIAAPKLLIPPPCLWVSLLTTLTEKSGFSFSCELCSGHEFLLGLSLRD